MLISTRGRYALQVMCDLLANGSDGFVPLKEIATRQDISLKYLESIMKTLVRGELVEASSGRGGGYRLLRDGKAYTVGEILRCTEGSLAPVACVEEDVSACARQESCMACSLWAGLEDAINGYLDGITLRELYARTEKHRKERSNHENAAECR